MRMVGVIELNYFFCGGWVSASVSRIPGEITGILFRQPVASVSLPDGLTFRDFPGGRTNLDLQASGQGSIVL